MNADDTPPDRLTLIARWMELFLVFFLVPALFAAYVDPERRFDPFFGTIGLDAALDPEIRRTRILLPALMVFSIVLLVILLFDRTFPNEQLWNFEATRRETPRILMTIAAGGVVMLAAAWALATYTGVLDRRDDSGFFYLPRNFPWIVALILVAYPWLSCYPQEIAHRAFFFHRYRAILPGRWSMIAVNAIAFCWLHAPFWSLGALLLTLPGGVIFAWTYDRTQSTLAVTLEHAILGWWAFVVGLGNFVFAGSIGR